MHLLKQRLRGKDVFSQATVAHRREIGDCQQHGASLRLLFMPVNVARTKGLGNSSISRVSLAVWVHVKPQCERDGELDVPLAQA